MIEDTKVLDLDTNKALQKVDLFLNSVRPVKVREIADALLQALKINPELTIRLITSGSICPIFEVPRDILEVAKEKQAKIATAIEATKRTLRFYTDEEQKLAATVASLEYRKNNNIGQ